MLFRQLSDPHLAQYAYLIGCQKTGEAILMDPERDVDRYIAAAEAEGLRIAAVAETHIHADFLSGARELAEQTGARIYLSAEGGEDWHYRWPASSEEDVTLLRDSDTFHIGNIRFETLHTPGHTPEHLCFLVTDEGGGATTPMGLVSGDFVFVGALGRPDLLEQAAGVHGMQEPSARQLFASLPSFLLLEEHLQVWPAHGAGSACGKALGAVPQTTVGYEKRYNASLAAAEAGEATFVQAILSGQPEPPLYFARMKRLNRDGVPPLGALPEPRRLTADDLGTLGDDTLVIDTRRDRSAFMASHLPGALYAPLNKSFSTAVGSVVTDPDARLVLIVEADDLDTAVRALVRIGYDHVEAYAEPEMLDRHAAEGGAMASIPEADFDAVAQRRDDPDAIVLDVRYASEFAAGHVPGAINAAYTRLPEHLDRIPGAHPLLVHCQSGVRSAVAAAYLAREGYDVVYVNGRFPDYAAAHPVETEAAHA